jgi:ornithine carbamoyltransferase
MNSDCCVVVRRKRSIVVLVNNTPTQMLADTKIDEEHGFKVINLSNLKLVFLPANTTSVVQLLIKKLHNTGHHCLHQGALSPATCAVGHC